MPAAFVPKPIQVPTAAEAAAQVLREAIISGALRGGDRILEQKWSVELRIGQPTLREALRELERQGLVRKVPQRGTYVTELDADDYRQILEVRLPLEAIAVARATERMTPGPMRRLEAAVSAMADTEEDAEARRFHDNDVLFHRTLWTVADNPYLAELLETITFRLFVFSIVGRWPGSPDHVGERRAAVEQHRRILAAIGRGDPRRAAATFVAETERYWNETYGLALKTMPL